MVLRPTHIDLYMTPTDRTEELYQLLQASIPDEDPVVRDTICTLIVNNLDMFESLRDQLLVARQWAFDELKRRTEGFTEADSKKVDVIGAEIQAQLDTRIQEIGISIVAEAHRRASVV